MNWNARKRWLLLVWLCAALGCGGRTVDSGSDSKTGTDQVTPPADTLQPSDTLIKPQDQTTPQADTVTPQPDSVVPQKDNVTPADQHTPQPDQVTPSGSVSVFFGPSGFVDAFNAEVNAAKTSIYLTIYQFTQSVFADALIAAHKRGVDVKVIFDQSQTGANTTVFNILKAEGISVIWSSTFFVYTHSKNMIVDGSRLLVMSHNLISYSIKSERNHGMITTDAELVKDALEVFDADWVNRAPKISGTRLIVSPQNSREKLLGLINSATKTLDFQHMQFSDSEVQAAVIARVKAGVAVRIMLADPNWITTNRSVACYLGKEGIDVYYQHEFENHAKLMIVDGKKAVVGSVNFSTNSMNNNREMSAVVEDSANLAKITSLFNSDWAKGVKITYDANKSCSAQ